MAPEEHPVIISEPTLVPRATRQATCQILFETFACPRVLQCNEAVMAAAAAGATSGIVLDVGHEWSRACAVYEGHAISHTHGSASLGAMMPCAVCRVCVADWSRLQCICEVADKSWIVLCSTVSNDALGGATVTQWLQERIGDAFPSGKPEPGAQLTPADAKAIADCSPRYEKGIEQTALAAAVAEARATNKRVVASQAVGRFKEMLCWVAPSADWKLDSAGGAAASSDSAGETKRDASAPSVPSVARTSLAEFVLPDGKKVSFSAEERYRCAEPLFDSAAGLPSLVLRCAKATDERLTSLLCSSIVLSGSTTTFDGFSERLAAELAAQAPASMKLKLAQQLPALRSHAVMLGGLVIGALKEFVDGMCVSKEQYEEIGEHASLHERIVHSRCI